MLPVFDFIKEKGIQVTWNWSSFIGEEHLYAFTSAKILKIDVLKSIKNTLVQAEKGKITKLQAKTLIAENLRKSGLWGKTYVENPSTKKPSYVNIGSNWRVNTIVQTNLQSAYMSRKWQNYQLGKDAKPYLKYVTAGDELVRPSHALLDGKIYHINNPIWKTIYPPNGYNCRCDTKSLSEKQALAVGIAKTNKIPVGFPDKGFALNSGISRNIVFSTLANRTSKLKRKQQSEILSSVLLSEALTTYLSNIENEDYMTKNYFVGYLPPFIAKKAGFDDVTVVGTNKLLTARLKIDNIGQIPSAIWKSRRYFKRDMFLFVVVSIGGEDKIITIQKKNKENKIVNIQDYNSDLLFETSKL